MFSVQACHVKRTSLSCSTYKLGLSVTLFPHQADILPSPFILSFSRNPAFVIPVDNPVRFPRHLHHSSFLLSGLTISCGFLNSRLKHVLCIRFQCRGQHLPGLKGGFCLIDIVTQVMDYLTNMMRIYSCGYSSGFTPDSLASGYVIAQLLILL